MKVKGYVRKQGNRSVGVRAYNRKGAPKTLREAQNKATKYSVGNMIVDDTGNIVKITKIYSSKGTIFADGDYYDYLGETKKGSIKLVDLTYARPYEKKKEEEEDEVYDLECLDCGTAFEVYKSVVGKPPFTVECPNCGADVDLD